MTLCVQEIQRNHTVMGANKQAENITRSMHKKSTVFLKSLFIYLFERQNYGKRVRWRQVNPGSFPSCLRQLDLGPFGPRSLIWNPSAGAIIYCLLWCINSKLDLKGGAGTQTGTPIFGEDITASILLQCTGNKLF